MNIEMALKSRSYILDHVKLFLGIFFFLSCLIKSIFHQLLGYTFIFVKTHTPKSGKYNVLPNFTCGKGSLVVPWSAIYLVINTFFFSNPFVFYLLSLITASSLGIKAGCLESSSVAARKPSRKDLPPILSTHLILKVIHFSSFIALPLFISA